MATYHPAYILRLTGGNMTAVKKLVWADLLAVRSKLDDTNVPPEHIRDAATDRGLSGPAKAAADQGLETELRLDL